MPVACRLSRTILIAVATSLALCLTASALAQVADARNESEAARLMLDNQAIVEVSANECKTKFTERGAAIDEWLGVWHKNDANLIAAAETINAKSPQPTLGAERRAAAEAKIAPGFNGAAPNDQLAEFCTRVFSPGTQDRLRDSQPKTVQFLTEAYDRLKRDGQLMQ
jgi:hypothetical protein